jgi:hypothetical protein
MMAGEFTVSFVVEGNKTQVFAETCVRCGESSEYSEIIWRNSFADGVIIEGGVIQGE